MSQKRMITIRVQSPEGTRRVECNQDDTTSSLYYKAQQAFKLDDIFGFKLYKDASKTSLILMHERKHLNDDYALKHGDMVYLNFENNSSTTSNSNSNDVHYQTFSSTSSSSTSLIRFETNDPNARMLFTKLTPNVSKCLEEIDIKLMSCNGLIQRKRDPKYCQHGATDKCLGCAPIEPYDKDYLKAHNIKHMSFHAFLRKHVHNVNKKKSVPLEDISCRIESGCLNHEPWPKGICTECSPKSLTLNRQEYRFVDNVRFENTSIVENFLSYWRLTGNQRMGFLYGYYSKHDDVPLGIKAVVVAIYEPPQESTRDHIKIHSDLLDLKAVDLVANEFNYKRIGWIFTDLIPADNGTVKHTRNKDTYFMSAEECIMAGFFQNCHPNACKLSKSGFYGSKFVSIVVTGNSENQVHMEGYQVSNQCMALVRDDCLLPCVAAPELAYVRESSKTRYVPDVTYMKKDEYGNEVSSMARPLPIEYLLVDVPVSVPKEEEYTFNPMKQMKPFPIENRLIDGHLQDLDALCQYMKQFNLNDQSSNAIISALSDFHLLTYLGTLSQSDHQHHNHHQSTTFNQEWFKQLLNNCFTRKDVTETRKLWSNVEPFLNAQNQSSASSSRLSSSSGGGSGITNSTSGTGESAQQSRWSCKYCTFENESIHQSCEMCNLPK